MLELPRGWSADARGRAEVCLQNLEHVDGGDTAEAQKARLRFEVGPPLMTDELMTAQASGD